MDDFAKYEPVYSQVNTPKHILHGKQASQLASKPIKPREWFAEHFIPMEHVTLIYGNGGEGKSLLGLQLICSVVTRKTQMELNVPQVGEYYLFCDYLYRL
ncbi:MAG: AAA family ATPase [Paracoccaceae bacterium]|jgi:hypothetical protein|nr:AAA family ATPase [Paracoccaceae bacterium]